MMSKHSAVELRGACNVAISKWPIILLPAKGLSWTKFLAKSMASNFFFSSVTAVETNAKKPKVNNNSEPDVYPAIAYFIVLGRRIPVTRTRSLRCSTTKTHMQRFKPSPREAIKTVILKWNTLHESYSKWSKITITEELSPC